MLHMVHWKQMPTEYCYKDYYTKCTVHTCSKRNGGWRCQHWGAKCNGGRQRPFPAWQQYQKPFWTQASRRPWIFEHQPSWEGVFYPPPRVDLKVHTKSIFDNITKKSKICFSIVARFACHKGHVQVSQIVVNWNIFIRITVTCTLDYFDVLMMPE